MKSKLISSRVLALRLAKAANILPEPDKIIRVAERQKSLQSSRGHVSLKPSQGRQFGRELPLSAFEVGSKAHKAYLQRVLLQSLSGTPVEQVLELESALEE